MTTYNWGIVRVLNSMATWGMDIDNCIPPDAKVLAVKDQPDNATKDYLVQHPSLPTFDPATGAMPQTVCLLVAVEEFGTYCYWEHAAEKRWLMR